MASNAYGYRNFNRLRNRILLIYNYDKDEAVPPASGR